MAVLKKRLRRRAAEPVCAASNEDDRHPLPLLMSLARSKTDLLLGSPPILFVADLLHPIHVLAAKGFLDGDVCHGGRG
jgi:hypothetical protein